jgi:hypothetical protein
MRKPIPPGNQRKVMLWPEKKIYNVITPIQVKQRTPVLKFSCVSFAAPQMIYFQGDPIILN